MIDMDLLSLANLLGIDNPLKNNRFTGISIDTRTLKPGNLFIAIPGERVDGHDYLVEAAEKGASAALVQTKREANLPQLIVNDTTTALGQLAAHWRDQFTIPFVAVTGSNGKTTLKNMIAAILTAKCHGHAEQVLATQGNFNNHWGLPLTLAQLNANHRYAVIEMGMNHFNEIKYLTELTKPHVAAITNAAACHLEGVGSLSGVAKAKAEIFLGLRPHGVAILNKDDAFFDYWKKEVGDHPVISFGLDNEADVSAILKPTAITINTPIGSTEINLPLLGKHNVLNALAAIAASIALKIDLHSIKSGLESIQPAKGRLQVHTLENGVKIIDDTYNANPFSLQAAVNTLISFQGKKILVLGDMKELGPEEQSQHSEAGIKIREAGIDSLFTFGELSAHSTKAFGEGAQHFHQQDRLIAALKPFLLSNTTILIKGSRSMHMEKIVAELIE